jgi:predicted transposase YbfD/YdcC
MARTNKFIAEYAEKFKTVVDFDTNKPPVIMMKRFIRYLKPIEDRRIAGMIHYPLEEIIVIAFLAVLGGAENWEDMELFGRSYQKWLKKFLKLENGIPSHDTFRRVFGLIRPIQLEGATVAYMSDIIGRLKKVLKVNDTDKRHICVDGKESRSTGRKRDTSEEIRNLQTLHIYDNTHGICLYSSAIGEKTNEIPVAQNILSCMQLKNSIVTFDAMNTQKRTIAIIREQKGDYVGALKGNQNRMDEEVRAYFTDDVRAKIIAKGDDYYRSSEKAHNHVEIREFFLTRKVRWFEDLGQWAGLKSFICYKKTMIDLVTGKQTVEERYYIASVTDVELCADAIRGHWGVENRLHWHLDVSFNEDGNTTVDRNAFSNLSLINKMTLSMLKLCKPLFKHNSIRSMRKQFGWTMAECLANVLNVLSNDELLESITISKS